MKAHFILYVSSQEHSTSFYRDVLQMSPDLNVPGMTEFILGEECVLGLMPVAGIRKLLGDILPDPSTAQGVPRGELYLVVDNPEEYHARALSHGAVELSSVSARDWGDTVGYSLDPDGHVLAFARKI